ncbi:hypothetical protein M2137_001874 [Parabacteroides sp. PFB2-10]|uniref:hypothetical protein n=1 Tax=Parabacteroides sp. PFB2-10 TaxID=1742405 RepID=UPI002476515C|nr:hypothetical protein [Parabacteroides sp. PFB2-10]MDH6313087.1 hypothetical protein [Parabacteroides sp. PFB2-10]MDL2215175.1 hypothetical protein [Dysgonomonas sp. OttesenSCG-928-M03]MDL2244952.1 hypothetical protein [Parabacteroides sp. OttesenSCG-928-J18]
MRRFDKLNIILLFVFVNIASIAQSKDAFIIQQPIHQTGENINSFQSITKNKTRNTNNYTLSSSETNKTLWNELRIINTRKVYFPYFEKEHPRVNDTSLIRFIHYDVFYSKYIFHKKIYCKNKSIEFSNFPSQTMLTKKDLTISSVNGIYYPMCEVETEVFSKMIGMRVEVKISKHYLYYRPFNIINNSFHVDYSYIMGDPDKKGISLSLMYQFGRKKK